jgi:hypothetical protein
MKAKNIKSVLSRKFADWLESIDSPSVVAAVKQDAIITGGAITSMLMGEKVNDYDVYFKTAKTAYSVAQYYVDKFKKNPPSRFKGSDQLVDIRVIRADDRVKVMVQSAGIASESGTDEYQYFEQVADDMASEEFVENTVQDAVEAAEADDEKKTKYRPVFLSSNAISLSHKIQIVIRFFGSVEEIHENYDFVHCTCSWDAGTGGLRLPPAALEAMLAKELRYKSSKYPLCSIIRTRKFLHRGWTITAGQYVKMAWELNALDLSDIEVLEDQLTGVDAAYFFQVLDLLRNHKTEGDKVDGAYLMQVIDKVFG